MTIRTFKTCVLATLLLALLNGCIHVHKEEKVTEPAPTVVTPPPPTVATPAP